MQYCNTSKYILYAIIAEVDPNLLKDISKIITLQSKVYFSNSSKQFKV